MAFDAALLQAIPYLSGLFAASFGFGIAKAKNKEDFDPKNFLETVIVGLVVNIVAHLAGISGTTAGSFTLIQLATILADKIYGVFSKTGSTASKAKEVVKEVESAVVSAVEQAATATQPTSNPAETPK